MSACMLCGGTGSNLSGLLMVVNNHICPRCGGYGTVSDTASGNTQEVNRLDLEYAACNGWTGEMPE